MTKRRRPRRTPDKPFQSLPRLLSVLASVLAAGVMLTVASCSHVTPLGPDPAATMPQPHQLQSPLVLEDMRMQHSTPGGGCPAGSVALSGSAGPCYRTTGTPATITSAGVSPITSFQPPTPPGQQQAEPTQYGFWITVPAADAPAVTAVIPAAEGQGSSGAQGPVASAVPASQPVPAISVAGQTSLLVGFTIRFTGREVEVFLASRNQALKLQRILAASG
jgi:hypothetical protein